MISVSQFVSPPLHSSVFEQGHPVSTTDIVVCKQKHDMKQICEFTSFLMLKPSPGLETLCEGAM